VTTKAGTVGMADPTLAVRAPSVNFPATGRRAASTGTAPDRAYALVSGLCLEQRREICKTVGSAYDGSNPTPATTSENAPLAANSRASGALLLCPGMYHLVAL
jgi:hypothetical protein